MKNAKTHLRFFHCKDRPAGNAASVEIRKQRGFPQLLGKVSPKSSETFPHFHRPYWHFLLFETGKTDQTQGRDSTLRNLFFCLDNGVHLR